MAAPFFSMPSNNRRSLIGKVHVAKKELCLDEDSYRGRMFRVTGKSSAADCSDEELVALLDDFRSIGWQARPKGKRTSAGFTRRAADHPSARKARALWISLAQMGAIENGSERALEAFAKRQLGCERLQWADQGQMFKLIEALVAIARRNGWDAKGSSVKQVKIRLLEALLAKLKAKGFAAESWDVATAAERIAGFDHPRGWRSPDLWEDGDIEAIAQAFARLLKNGRKDA